MKLSLFLIFLFSILQTFILVVFGHNSIIYPCPRYSKAGLECSSDVPKGIELTDEENYPIYSKEDEIIKPLCKYTTPWPGTTVKWTPGQEVTVQFNSWSVSHSGGHCQFSISYDNGKTFAVIHEVLRYCFLKGKPEHDTEEVEVYDYTFTLPDLPASDGAVFVWTWVAAVGNREFFMNCADIIIENSTAESYTNKTTTIANYPGYPTIPEFRKNYDTGLEYYDVDSITVYPNGTSIYANGTRTDNPIIDFGTSSSSTSKTDKKEDDVASTTKGKSASKSAEAKNQSSDEESTSADLGNEEDDKCDDEVDNGSDSNTDTEESTDDGFDYVCDDTDGNTDTQESTDDGFDYVCDDSDESTDESTNESTDETISDNGETSPTAGPVLDTDEPDYDCTGSDDDEDSTALTDVMDILSSIAAANGLGVSIIDNTSSDLSTESPTPTSTEAASLSSGSSTLNGSPTSSSDSESEQSATFVLFEYSSKQGSVATETELPGLDTSTGSSSDISETGTVDTNSTNVVTVVTAGINTSSLDTGSSSASATDTVSSVASARDTGSSAADTTDTGSSVASSTGTGTSITQIATSDTVGNSLPFEQVTI